MCVYEGIPWTAVSHLSDEVLGKGLMPGSPQVQFPQGPVLPTRGPRATSKALEAPVCRGGGAALLRSGVQNELICWQTAGVLSLLGYLCLLGLERAS